MATPEDTLIVFGLGSGAFDVMPVTDLDWHSGEPGTNVGWWIEWTDETDGKQFRVEHECIMRAVNKFARNKQYRKDWRDECWNFLRDPESADFDAVSASAIVETAAYGHPVYV